MNYHTFSRGREKTGIILSTAAFLTLMLLILLAASPVLAQQRKLLFATGGVAGTFYPLGGTIATTDGHAAAWISAASFASFALIPIAAFLASPQPLRVPVVAAVSLASLAALGAFGLAPLDCLGKPFDHKALLAACAPAATPTTSVASNSFNSASADDPKDALPVSKSTWSLSKTN